MKIKTYLALVATLLILSCGGGSSSSNTSEAEVNEAEIVDSISTAVDEMKADLSTETESTVQEIDSLLNDI